MIDLKALNYNEFEMLIGLLLSREGHEILRGPSRAGMKGPDYETISPQKQSVLVEVKHFIRSQIGRHQLVQFAGDVERYRQQKENARGLLVISGALGDAALEEMRTLLPNVEVWHEPDIASLLAKHQDVEPLFQSIISARKRVEIQASEFTGQDSRALQLMEKVKALPCGINHWKDYERICTDILTSYIFTRHCHARDSKAEVTMDWISSTRYFLFAQISHRGHWFVLSFELDLLLLNLRIIATKLDRSRSKSIAQYLWRPAQRYFGLLLSRQRPSDNALAQRRRKWLEEEKCIIFLSDDDLVEMLQLRNSSGDPFDVIDAQIEEFFRTLTP